MSNKNRNKGHNAERKYSKIFKELGYSKCQTSRYGSRLHDDSKIDLINIPFNVQIKAGKQRGLNISKELEDMQEKIKENFLEGSPEFSNPSVVIHEKEVGRGKKRTKFDTTVSMTFEDYLILISKNDIQSNEKRNKRVL